MNDIALGVTVHNRTKKLKALLNSITSQPIGKVYIADNGQVESKDHIYNKTYPFDLNVLDVKFDSGLGYGRKTIVDELEEEYLIIVDSDMKLPKNVETLKNQHEELPEFGGIGGTLVESNRIRSNCFDLFENGDVLIKDIRSNKYPRIIAGFPLIEFESIQNAAMYKKECLEDYCWDPKYKIGWEHEDFFVGHKKNTDWRFGVSPTVMFEHYPGGKRGYNEIRNDIERIRNSKNYFLNKWDYNQVIIGEVKWIDTSSNFRDGEKLAEGFYKNILLNSPPSAQAFAADLRDWVRKLKGDPPL